MSCRHPVYQWTHIVTTHFPHLSKSQARVLALWSLGMVVARSCALSAVSVLLAQWLDQGQHRAAAVAGILLRNSRQARSGPPRGGRRDLLCPLVGMGVELVGRAPAGTSRGRDDLGATVCGVGAECPLSRVCHSSGVDRAARRAETRLARGVVAHAAPGARSRAAALLRARLGRSGVVRPLVVSTYRAAGLASGLRINTGGTFRPATSTRYRPLRSFVPQPGTQWAGRGTAFVG